MEVSINSGISNIGTRNVDQNSEKTIGFKNVGQKDSESETISQNWVNQHLRLSYETDGSIREMSFQRDGNQTLYNDVHLRI